MMYGPACLAVCNLRPCCRLLQCPAWQHRPAWLLQQLQPGNRRGCCRWRDHCSAAAPPGLRCTLQHCTGSRLPLFYYRINSDDVQVVPSPPRHKQRDTTVCCSAFPQNVPIKLYILKVGRLRRKVASCAGIYLCQFDT